MSSKQFASCVLTPVQGDSSSQVAVENGKYKASSYYLDSSGRSSVSVPLQLKFPSKEVLEAFLASKCFHPVPSNYDDHSQGGATEGERANQQTEKSICIEAKVTLTFGTGHAITAKVEGVTILSSKIDTESSSVFFNTDIIVRVSRSEGDNGEGAGVKTNLEITAAFSERSGAVNETVSALEVLTSLNRGGFGDGTSSHRRVSVCRLPPLALHVALTHALAISARSIPGPSMGQTFLALTMKHSDTHQQPVTVTSISLHPGVSRQYEKDGSSLKNSASRSTTQHTVTDMSNSVRWGYAENSDPGLPLTLHPNEAYSTILSVDASEDSIARLCVCPLSITAVIGSQEHQNHIVAAADAVFATSRAAVEPADSFRVDMSLEDGNCVVGAPLTVNMEISNLSADARQLMLLVDSSSETNSWSKKGRWAIVSEADGYKFGIGGPDGERDLLAVDAALLLGELKGHASTKARLRVIPLREGTLKLPNFALVCSRSGRKYNCVHRLQAVAQAAK